MMHGTLRAILRTEDTKNVTLVSTDAESPAISAEARVLEAYYKSVERILWMAVPPLLLLLGSGGNVMIILVMRRMRTAQSTAAQSVYLTALAVSDQVFLTSAMCWFWPYYLLGWPSSWFRHSQLLCTLPWFLWYTCSLTSAWILVALTYKRVMSVVAPHRVGLLCSVRRAKVVVGTVVTTAVLFNHHFLYTFCYDLDLAECLPRARFVPFVTVFTWLDLVLACLLPFALLVVGNTILVWQVVAHFRFSRKFRQQQGQEVTSSATSGCSSMTRTLIVTSSAFLLFTLPTCVFDLYIRGVDTAVTDCVFLAKIYLVESVTLFLWFGNSAFNCFLYLLSGRKFRQEAVKCLKCVRRA